MSANRKIPSFTDLAWRVPFKGPTKAVLVFYCYHDYSQTTGETWYSQAEVGRLAGVADRTVRRVNAELKRAGLIAVEGDGLSGRPLHITVKYGKLSELATPVGQAEVDKKAVGTEDRAGAVPGAESVGTLGRPTSVPAADEVSRDKHQSNTQAEAATRSAAASASHAGRHNEIRTGQSDSYADDLPFLLPANQFVEDFYRRKKIEIATVPVKRLKEEVHLVLPPLKQHGEQLLRSLLSFILAFEPEEGSSFDWNAKTPHIRAFVRHIDNGNLLTQYNSVTKGLDRPQRTNGSRIHQSAMIAGTSALQKSWAVPKPSAVEQCVHHVQLLKACEKCGRENYRVQNWQPIQEAT